MEQKININSFNNFKNKILKFCIDNDCLYVEVTRLNRRARDTRLHAIINIHDMVTVLSVYKWLKSIHEFRVLINTLQ